MSAAIPVPDQLVMRFAKLASEFAVLTAKICTHERQHIIARRINLLSLCMTSISIIAHDHQLAAIGLGTVTMAIGMLLQSLIVTKRAHKRCAAIFAEMKMIERQMYADKT